MKYDLRTENEIPPFIFPFHSQAIGNFIRRFWTSNKQTNTTQYALIIEYLIVKHNYNEEQRITTWLIFTWIARDLNGREQFSQIVFTTGGFANEEKNNDC